MHIDGKVLRSLKFQSQSPRLVPPFSYQSLRPNTFVYPPPRSFPFKKRSVKCTMFRLYLERGDIPISRGGPVKKKKKEDKGSVNWLIDPDKLDYCYYLPIFIDGLAESNEELRELAFAGAMDLISRGSHKILPTIPQLIIPFKRGFNTRDVQIIVGALKVIQQMVILGPCVGQALVPYYRQLLPVCNLFKPINVNLGDGIDNDRDNRIGDVIEDTLQILEKCGGPDAYINIKYMVPTYESCVMN